MSGTAVMCYALYINFSWYSHVDSKISKAILRVILRDIQYLALNIYILKFLAATGTPVSSGFQSQSRVLPYSLFAEANVMYIPQDPPLVLHVPTSWQPACCQSCPHIMLQR